MNDNIGERMKRNYESVSDMRLVRRMPVIIRIDGKAFHTFTKGFVKPFDKVLIEAMQATMESLCMNIQGCVLGYTQSDEISLLLVDYKELDTSAWFDYRVQKLCSVAAALATVKFNKIFRYYQQLEETLDDNIPEHIKNIHFDATLKDPAFDARCFNIPKEEVTNYFFWRQQDATRNSIQMVGQSKFSHKELMNKSCNDIQDMLFTKHGINWNELPIYQKRGCCCVKNAGEWVIDREIPIFKGEGREYIDTLVRAEGDGKNDK